MAATLEIPAADVPDPTLLIARYHRVLEAAEEVPAAFLVRRRPGRLNWFGRSLRTTVLLRFFIRWHVLSTVSELRRAALGRAAAEPCEPCYAEVAQRLEHFEKSLPAVRLKQALVVTLVSVFLVAFLLARAAPPWDPTLSFLFDDKATPTVVMSDAADPLASMTGAMLTLNPREVGSALASFACRTVRGDSAVKGAATTRVCSSRRALVSSVTSVILLGVAAWLVALLPLTAFRLKRMLFNMDADDDVRGCVRSEVARDHIAAASGIYRLEADLFRALGRRPHRELPLDLAGQACIQVIPLWLAIATGILCASSIKAAVDGGLSEGQLTAIVTFTLLSVGLAVFPAARLSSLRWAHRRRSADAAGQADPALTRATLRRRLLAHATDTVPFVLLGLLLLRRAAPFATSEVGGLVAVFILCPLAVAVVHGAFIARGGRTFGKAVWGLRVVGGAGTPVSKWRLLVREALVKGSALGIPWLLLPELWRRMDSYWAMAIAGWSIALIAYACAAWNLRRSPLHDLMLDTVVVRERRRRATASARVLAPA